MMRKHAAQWRATAGIAFFSEDKQKAFLTTKHAEYAKKFTVYGQSKNRCRGRYRNRERGNLSGLQFYGQNFLIGTPTGGIPIS